MNQSGIFLLEPKLYKNRQQIINKSIKGKGVTYPKSQLSIEIN